MGQNYLKDAEKNALNSMTDKFESGYWYTEVESNKISKMIHQYKFDRQDAVAVVVNSSLASSSWMLKWALIVSQMSQLENVAKQKDLHWLKIMLVLHWSSAASTILPFLLLFPIKFFL